MLVVASVIAGVLLVEAGYRAWLYYSGTFDETTLTVLRLPSSSYPEIGAMRAPGSHSNWRIFDKEHNLVFETDIRINRAGFRSDFQYPIAKEPGELRIAVLGDSFVEGLNNNFTWVDELQRVLVKSDLSKKYTKIRVMNFGEIGAGIQRMLINYTIYAEKFQPDLVVLNFLDDDIRRIHGVRTEKDRAMGKIERWQRQVEDQYFKINPMDDVRWPPTIDIDGVRVHLVCQSEPHTLENRACFPWALFYADDIIANDKKKMLSVKKKLMNKIMGRLWFSPNPLSLYAMMGYPPTLNYLALRQRFFDEVLRPKAFAETPAASQPVQDSVSLSADAILTLKAEVKDLIVIYNPQFQQLARKNPDIGLAELQEKIRAIRIVDTRTYLPLPAAEGEITTWFNLPHDGHWSDKGARIYARAVAGIVAEHVAR